MNNIKSLDDYKHSRLRTENLYGSREVETKVIPIFNGETLISKEISFVPSLFTTFREILDNALDEVVTHKFGDTIWINYNENDLIFCIKDNGRGIPIHYDENLGGIIASVALSRARTGRNFEERSSQAGMNGLGASGVNFTSKWFELEILRDKQLFYQKWEEGETHLTDGHTISKKRSSDTYTKVTWQTSEIVFPVRVLPSEIIKSHLYQIAALNPNVKICFNDEYLLVKKSIDPYLSTILFDKKVASFYINDGEEFNANFYVITNFSDKQLCYGLINHIPSWNGLEHIENFQKLFITTVMEELSGKAKRKKIELKKDDVDTGMLVLSNALVKDAVFDSQSKSRLTKNSINTTIRKNFDKETVFTFIKKNPEWVEEIFSRALLRQENRDLDALKKNQKTLKKAKVLKLYPATSTNIAETVLFLMEGDSAIGNIIPARDPKKHAVLPLRGKPKNVHSATLKEISENKVYIDIMSSVGLTIGEKAIKENLNVGAIYIATDEDLDGNNITALLTMFFYRGWPELFDKENPFIFKFQTPFIIAKKGKNKDYYYARNMEEFEKNVHKYKSEDITRAKGLAALEDDDWQMALKNPSLVPIIDDGDLKLTLDLIFEKNEADLRKEWMAYE